MVGLRRLLTVLWVVVCPVVAHGLALTNDLLFTTTDQSMWSPGATAEWRWETFLGRRWGTYAGEAAVDRSLGIDVGAASVRGGFRSSGEAGIVPWLSAVGGSIEVSLPLRATVTLPDRIAANRYFRVSTAARFNRRRRSRPGRPASRPGSTAS